ncbi:hypothetical protein BGX38DRAFT_1209065 [Terfezia claveryi]|nr:hypothetical protein BGX38DRAFT_1209065 [Terfezia claveryi]
MKSVFVVLAAFAASVLAQLDVPPCAQPCTQPMLTQKVDDCNDGDVKCICSSKTAIASVGKCLIERKCSEADIQKTIATAYSLCQGVGVTIPTIIPSATTTVADTITTGTVTSITTATTTVGHNTTANHTSTTTVATTSSAGAAATGYVANGLGVAGAAVAAFLFL